MKSASRTNYRSTSRVKGQTPQETQVVGVPFVMGEFSLQTEDVPVVFDVGGESLADATDRILENEVD